MASVNSIVKKKTHVVNTITTNKIFLFTYEIDDDELSLVTRYSGVYSHKLHVFTAHDGLIWTCMHVLKIFVFHFYDFNPFIEK